MCCWLLLEMFCKRNVLLVQWMYGCMYMKPVVFKQFKK